MLERITTSRIQVVNYRSTSGIVESFQQLRFCYFYVHLYSLLYALGDGAVVLKK